MKEIILELNFINKGFILFIFFQINEKYYLLSFLNFVFFFVFYFYVNFKIIYREKKIKYEKNKIND